MACKRCNGKGIIRGFADPQPGEGLGDRPPSPRVISRPCPVCTTRKIEPDEMDLAFPDRPDPTELAQKRKGGFNWGRVIPLTDVRALEMLYQEMTETAEKLVDLAARQDMLIKKCWIMLRAARERESRGS